MAQARSVIDHSGPGYITKAVHSFSDGSQKIITSRRHRKGRGPILIDPQSVKQIPVGQKNPWLRFWAPSRLTWWVAILFIIGSALFSLGGYGSVFKQGLPISWTEGMTLDWIFFIGSIFFTAASFSQLLESINAGDSAGLYPDEKPSNKFLWVSWQPKRIGYMASLIQLIGAIMFNFNTGNVFLNNLSWIQQDLLIWMPNMIGCICFLIASRLAFMEVAHGYWKWQPGNIEWWITVINLLGSVGFMISAVYSLAVPAGDSSASFTWLSAFFTFQGGVFFFIGSYLLLPEMFSE